MTFSAYAADEPFVNGPTINCLAYSASPSATNAEVPASWHELGVGEWRVIDNLCPQVKHFPTGVILSPGAVYRISAVGKWRDGFLPPVGPNGWNGWILTIGNRIRLKPMFMLSASIGMDDKWLYSIGANKDFTTPSTLPVESSHHLYLFANDLSSDGFYANNREATPAEGGPMRVTIRRIK